MSPDSREPLRVALLRGGSGAPLGSGPERLAHELAAALRDAGHRPSVLTSHRAATSSSVEEGVPVVRSRRLPEAPLRLRGFTGPLTHIPMTLRALHGGGYDVAHAFSPPDALAALSWRRLTGRPAVFTWTGQVRRESLADRRLRLWLVRRATEESDAVIAPNEALRAGMWRWLMVEPAIIAAGDAAAHERLYRELIAQAR